jgi:hypothetical protein
MAGHAVLARVVAGCRHCTTATTTTTAAAGRTAGIATSASTGAEQKTQRHYTKVFAAHGDAPGYLDRSFRISPIADQ